MYSEYGHWLTCDGITLIDSGITDWIGLVDETDFAKERGFDGLPALRNPETGEVMDPETGEYYVWINDDGTLGW